MKKSKTRGKKASNSKDLDIKVEKKYPMINRKEVQAELDKDKNIRRLLDVGAYNLNQIAGMLMLPLERVKKVKNER